jgi:hypothetical protein
LAITTHYFSCAAFDLLEIALGLGNWVSLAEAARIRGVSRQAIVKLVNNARFETLKVGGRTFVDSRQVSDYQSRRAGRPSKRPSE